MHLGTAPLPPHETEKDVADDVAMVEDIGAADITHEGANAVHTVDGVSWTQEEERAIVRKMDWNIVPLVWALFMQVSGQSPLFVRSTDPFFEADPLFDFSRARAGYPSLIDPVSGTVTFPAL